MRNPSRSSGQSTARWPEHPGLHFYSLADRPDYEAITETVNASFAADGVENTISAEELESYYEHTEGLDPARDVITGWAGDRMVAESFVLTIQEQGGSRIFFHHSYIRPEWRAPELLAGLLAWTEDRAAEIQSQLPARPARLRTIVREGETEFAELLASRGHEIERYFYSMVRPDLKQIPPAPSPPDLEIRPVEAEHHRAIWQAKVEAFRDHWGTREVTEEDYERWLANPLHDRTLWKIAWDGDEVAGMVLNFIDESENQAKNRKRGYTEDIAVRRPWRRRGLASHLLAESLRELRRRGMREAALSVDVENPSGALDFYQRFGYEVSRQDVIYARPV